MSYIFNPHAPRTAPGFVGGRSIWERLHIDGALLALILILIGIGCFVLYSAANQNVGMFERQLVRFALAMVVMTVIAQVPPRYFCALVPFVYTGGLILLLLVLLMGDVGKGAQRWLDLKVIRFQPSEFMKLAVPMMVAYYFSEKPLPCTLKDTLVASMIIVVPVLMIAKQPDLGTALLIAASGFCVLFLAGLPWRYLFGLMGLGALAAPVLWHFLHDYQRKRILMFLNPELDPLGAGYHTIQSKIAIGSGGPFGKGWLQGTQSHLEFLPERSTDFIFAVMSEELGLFGALTLYVAYYAILWRMMKITVQAQSTFARLLAGSITLTFAIYVIINTGMVSGVLPVVGVPLPLISYGGTSVVTLFAGFGILMSIQTHRQLVSD
ncbi:MAG: rod shape-determining protein RodA [Gammaproteobacteria bacterium]